MKFRNAVVVGSLFALASGCAYLPDIKLPQGFPSRTAQTSTEKLFISDGVQKEVPVAAGARRVASAPEKPGLRIRKSKRGNMESYVVRGQRYYTLDSAEGYSARGVASWYGPNFHGRTASNGEVYDMYRLTAAHKTLPLPTYARVTHTENNRSVIVKINDRGPFSGDRIIDLSFAAALRLGMVNDGTATVEIQALSADEMMALSGPENKLDIDFYYAAADGGESEIAESIPLLAEGTDDEVISVAAVDVDDKPITALPITDTSTAILSSDTSLLSDLVVTEAPAVESDDSSVLLPLDDGQTIAMNQPVATDAEIQEALVPAAAGANVQVPVPAAVQAVRLPSGKDRSGYYIQAGVFADVTDAEKVAVDVVLAAPGEEVHVKPLKDSHMYRITVGPIVTSDHANKVSGKLSAAGLDNFTVNVK